MVRQSARLASEGTPVCYCYSVTVTLSDSLLAQIVYIVYIVYDTVYMALLIEDRPVHLVLTPALLQSLVEVQHTSYTAGVEQ